MLWVPFSSPLTGASPFFDALGWFPEVEAAVAQDACCWANLSRKACCRVCTTSGITASMSDSDSIGRPSNTVPSCWDDSRRQGVVRRRVAIETVNRKHLRETFHALTSLMLISASTYWSPFCRMEMRAAGGTSVPFMLDWLMWLSMPKVNAEWEKPERKNTICIREREREPSTQCSNKKHKYLVWFDTNKVNE